MHRSLTKAAVVVLAVLAMFSLGLAACGETPAPLEGELTPIPTGASPAVVSPEVGGETIGVEATKIAPTLEPAPASTEPPGGEPDCGCTTPPAWQPQPDGDTIGGEVRLHATPVAQACVRIYDSAKKRKGETVTDGTGQYQFNNLPAGTWLLAAARLCGQLAGATPVAPMVQTVVTGPNTSSTSHTADFDFE